MAPRSSRKVPYPFVKWAGGKTKMIGHILANMPAKIGTYYEPFIGGGAVFFELARQKRFDRAIIGDLNEELMNTYHMIRDDVDGLIKVLKQPRYKYQRSAYLKIRALDPNKIDALARAARFIYLNRTCFNGLYRVNQSGGFNVPFGKYTNPVICDETNLRAVSEVLVNVELAISDFDQIVEDAHPGDVVYFDPPYLPLSPTSNFTGYNEGGFSIHSHERLARTFSRLKKRRVKAILSNSSSAKSIELYSKFKIEYHIGSRVVGGPAEYRKSVSEILVVNS